MNSNIWEDFDNLSEDYFFNLASEEDIKDVKELCTNLIKNKIIFYRPNEQIIKILIQVSEIIKLNSGGMSYDTFVPLATGKSSELIDLIFAIAIVRHIPGKGQNEGDIRPFEESLVAWHAFGKSREDENILMKALGFERADYIETKDYFSAGFGNGKPDLVDLNNGWTFDVKSYDSIDKVNAQKNREPLFILLTSPSKGTVSLYIRAPKTGQIELSSPTTEYKLVDENYIFDNPDGAIIKNYLKILENVRVPLRVGSSYEKPNKIINNEELFTENNFKLLDALLRCRKFEWPLKKR